MPTIKQIAQGCGVSKSTARRKLEELGLLDDGHTTKVGKTLYVSDYAASVVASALTESETETHTISTPTEIHNRYIAVLEEDKARLIAQVEEKDKEIARLNEALINLSHKLADQKLTFWQRLLPGKRQ